MNVYKKVKISSPKFSILSLRENHSTQQFNTRKSHKMHCIYIVLLAM